MMSDNCDFKGENTVYFYPDCRTAIIGTFDAKSQLKSGHITELVGVDKDAAFNPEPVFLGPNTDVSANSNTSICPFSSVPLSVIL